MGEQADPVLGERFLRAVAMAIRLHARQPRKGGSRPYLGHLLAVAALVIEDGGGEDEIVAALLHDGPEDAGGHETLAGIEREFGPRVAAIVAALSDTFEQPKPEWWQRKRDYLATLAAHEDPAVLRVSLADKLHNLRSVRADYRLLGEELWPRFETGRKGQLWYYRELRAIYAGRCPSPMAEEFARTLAELERLVGEAAAS